MSGWEYTRSAVYMHLQGQVVEPLAFWRRQNRCALDMLLRFKWAAYKKLLSRWGIWLYPGIRSNRLL